MNTLPTNRMALLFLCCMALAMPASAADKNPVEVPPPPPLSTPKASDYPEDGFEPEVTIVPKEKETHEEHRINGRLYMIKVIPKKGPPYYLIDTEGNGQFTKSEFSPQIAIPMWVIKKF